MLTPSTQHTSFQSFDRLNGLANSTNPAYPTLTASCEPVEPHRNEAIPCNNGFQPGCSTTEALLPPMLTLPLLQNTSRPATRFNTGYPQLEAKKTLQPGIPPSIEALRCNNPASAICDDNDYNENNEIFLTSAYQSMYAHQAPAEPPSTLEDGPGTNGHGAPENLEEREQGEDIIINQEEEYGTTYTNVEFLPKEDSESETGTEIDSLDEQDESGNTHELNDMSGSNLSSKTKSRESLELPPLGSVAARLAAALSSVGLSSRAFRDSEPVFSIFGKQYDRKLGISCHRILGAQEMILAL
ncbi:hypothetical protein TGAM01_v211137 [Trichoderma gamsii]|uniref:Uncharacterized protein n=1 Tax=Trichoderma gamsii TaxID=398673 RepID=A0A2P4Z6S7_9HYPO|nr:hypothetical protein TGAM01_v211137 [Trichoderma gamsii]PON19998.1 hypothetical protein TGAM01_v211137 [Trichoderma gamsii]